METNTLNAIPRKQRSTTPFECRLPFIGARGQLNHNPALECVVQSNSIFFRQPKTGKTTNVYPFPATRCCRYVCEIREQSPTTRVLSAKRFQENRFRLVARKNCRRPVSREFDADGRQRFLDVYTVGRPVKSYPEPKHTYRRTGWIEYGVDTR